MNQNYYEILKVSAKSTFKDIKASYRNLSLEFHPDVSSSPNAREKFIEINEAYHILKDPVRRARYDALLSSNSQKKSHQRWERKTHKSAEKGRARATRRASAPPKESSGKWSFFDFFGDSVVSWIFDVLSSIFS